MGKGKTPRKRRDPVSNEPADGEKEVERQTQEKAELVPPARRPPTAVGAETPPLPPRESPRRPPSPVPEHHRPTLFQLVQALRHVVGAMLDLADAAAEAITKRREGRA
jgi:hypothetical protein